MSGTNRVSTTNKTDTECRPCYHACYIRKIMKPLGKNKVDDDKVKTRSSYRAANIVSL